MPHPKEVNPAKFQVEEILYHIDGFSIAYGLWENGSKYLAVRWDGEEGTTGFPQTFGKPQWLILPNELTIAFTKALLDTDNKTDKKPIIHLLQKIIS